MYEGASGQKINYDKSEVVFSKKVTDNSKAAILNALGVREVDKYERYLGLPTIIGRSKKAIFAGIKDQVWKKLQGWKERMLSKSGKEVINRAVAQAIPSYMMSLFLLPVGLIDELHSIMARFWWGSSERDRKLHWWSWNKLRQPKSMGGMGFRDLSAFNHALLANQLWRLLTNPGSLVGRIFKAKYFKNNTILEARRGYDPSYVWRSLWNAKALLLDGIRWRVGNGKDIGVWEKAWLPVKQGMEFQRQIWKLTRP
ncbi:putative mitochondrial protein AtMg00310 [Silene latifolia]|uniref:putative mitochondrial protein AtMg00310 n=1 Tax=Silene latifolia TaxID=37657 RepID=UPI003D77DAE1